jgi:hypothetical protein
MKIDRGLLYKNFFTEVIIYFLPLFLPLPGLLLGGLGGALIGLAIGSILKINYQMREAQSAPSDVVSEMENVYASPMRGKPVLFDGQIVGRGVAGYMFSEDMMFQDRTGLMYLDYQDFYSDIGNIFFAMNQVKKLIGQNVKVEGWFFRGITQHLNLRKIHHREGVILSHPKIWFVVGNSILIAIGIFLITAKIGIL